MDKIVIEGPKNRNELPSLLEGYMHGLGEACHQLFGAEGEAAMYLTVGHFFSDYLRDRLRILIDDQNPWERYCHIIDVFTSHGFYDHVEMKDLGKGKYWMLETNQYAGQVWEGQKAWERGTPPCPLWALMLSLLADIDYTIVLDRVSFNSEFDGYESTFHFEHLKAPHVDIVEDTKKKLLSSMITFCCSCQKVRDPNGNWVAADVYLHANYSTTISHGYCPDCEATATHGLGEVQED